MLNLKNNGNFPYSEICKKKKAKIKIKFQKMKGTFLDSKFLVEKSPTATGQSVCLSYKNQV